MSIRDGQRSLILGVERELEHGSERVFANEHRPVGVRDGRSYRDGLAMVGLSQLREQGAFAGLPIHKSLLPLKCGIVAIDVPSGKILGMMEMTSGCSELFDVQWLPGWRGVQIAPGVD